MAEHPMLVIRFKLIIGKSSGLLKSSHMVSLQLSVVYLYCEVYG